jgi:hypothetical protein
MWASGHNGEIKRAAHGYEPTREATMAAFAKSAWWDAQVRAWQERRRLAYGPQPRPRP